MITPLSLPDPEKASDAQVIAAYIEDGCTDAEARANLAMLRGDLPSGVTAD